MDLRKRRVHALSEQSIAEGNRTLDFPDFTAGEWQKRKSIFAFHDRF